MLARLELHNFRRHTNLVVDFMDGINVIRASNEGGKSTIIEAVSYAMFGAKSLRTPLEDTVTWGEDVKKLKVELTLTSEGEVYTFKRSKAGAEVLRGTEVYITGQNEVSSFAANLLGADSAIAGRLMFASQNGIRGALEEGPKALSQMIEDLAGFSTFDLILEAAQQKLALGSSSLTEERLKGAESTLAAATEMLPPKPDAEAFVAAKQEIELSARVQELALPGLIEAAATSEKIHTEASEKFMHKERLGEKIEAAKAKVLDLKLQEDELFSLTTIHIDHTQVAYLKEQIAEAEDYGKRVIAYRKFLNLPLVERYSATADGFEADFSSNAVIKQNLSDEIQTLKLKVSDLKHQRINHDKCDKCGQDITHLDTVKATNARVDKELGVLVPELERAMVTHQHASNMEASMGGIRRFATKFFTAVKPIESFVAWDITTFPPMVTWNGNAPDMEIAPEAPYRELVKLEEAIKAVESAKSKLEWVQGLTRHSTEILKELEDELAAADGPDPDEMLAIISAKDMASLSVWTAQNAMQQSIAEAKALTDECERVSALWGMAQARVTDSEKVIAACKADLDSLAYNNGLVKKLRTIRPTIANRLWNTVLASVSVMFSQIRCEKSIVTKEKGGFSCNSQSIESLSGSTLDALGVALRVALLRTFVPQCGLLVLDEPASGMDGNRTEAMLGFLQSIGMGQTILITHEGISESIANNIIEL